jgi:hypothetical protein
MDFLAPFSCQLFRTIDTRQRAGAVEEEDPDVFRVFVLSK